MVWATVRVDPVKAMSTMFRPGQAALGRSARRSPERGMMTP